MSINQRLWFDMQRTFAEIQHVCVEARAVELLNRRREAEGAGLEDMLERASVYLDSDLDVRFREADTISHDPAFIAKHEPGTGIDIVAMRTRLRKQLSWLKTRLADDLTEREVYYCLFPIVIYTDELVHETTVGAASHWEPLQGELYDVDNGGEVFFTTVDTLLHKDDTHPLIFEVFFYCLNDGFVGQYDGNAGKVHEYRRRLADRIPIERPSDDGTLGPTAAVELVSFPARFYGAAALGALALFALLQVVAFYEVGQEKELLDQGIQSTEAMDDDAPSGGN